MEKQLIPTLQEFKELGIPLKEYLSAIERSLVTEAMVAQRGCITRAAKDLGLKRTTLHMRFINGVMQGQLGAFRAGE